MNENLNLFKEKTFLLALENAHLHKGVANPKALLGKLIACFPEIKTDMPFYISSLNDIVEQVNKLPLNEQHSLLLEKNPKALEKKKSVTEKKDGLPTLSNTQEPVIVRFPPAPSGYLHLGHLLGITANYEIKKKFNGTFILRFEDTNPENISLANYKQIIEDVKWVCEGKIDAISYQSDRLELYYKVLGELFDKECCYICFCTSQDFKTYTDKKEPCPHRLLKREEQTRFFNKFMKGELEGAVVRSKADIHNKNPALRSFALARINSNAHVRVGKKYSVWPNYNLAVSVDDHLMKLTHVIRGKDLEIGEIRQAMIFDSLGWKKPEYFHYGRIKFTDMELSKTALSQKIEQGEFEGWDDPRVPSICSHRKRGYKAKALREYILSLGISKRDSKINSKEFYKGLHYFNKQIIEKEANRVFYGKRS